MSPDVSINDIYQTFKTPPNIQCQYQIRPMFIEDIANVVEIERVTWPTSAWSSDHFFYYFDDPTCKCWILESSTTDPSILGYGIQYLSNDTFQIANLCIHPNQRGRGLGGILLRYMINYARQCDVLIVVLEVDTSNTHAYMLYYNHGFRITQYLHCYYSDYSHAYKMTLVL